MRILITGVSGLLGINMAIATAKKHTVFGVYHRHPIKAKSFKTLQADLSNPKIIEQLLGEIQPEWVINCAALANLDACEENTEQARQLNTELPRNLAKYVARGGARLVHISTDAVFDGKRGNYGEEDSPNPLSIYAKTKLAGEKAVVENNPDAIIARVNFYGWSLTGMRSLAEFFFNNLSAQKQVMGFTDVHFCPLNVLHLSELLIKMLQENLHGIYHVVSSECLTKYKFGIAIAKKFNFDSRLIKPAKLAELRLKAPRAPFLTLKTDKLTRDLGVTPPDLSTGLAQFYTSYQQGYPQFIQSLQDFPNTTT